MEPKMEARSGTDISINADSPWGELVW